MVGIAEISAGLSSLKAAKDIIQGLNAAATQATVNEVKIDLQSHILDAQTALFAAQQAEATLTGRISDLEQEIVCLKDWSAERERYQLVSIARIAFAYMPKPGMENRKPAHWLCTNCFDQGRKSFMQHNGSVTEALYSCNACRTEFRIPNGWYPDYDQRQPLGS